MKVQQIFDLALRLGIQNDLRGKRAVQKYLDRKKQLYEKLPKDFSEVLSTYGVGPKSLRALTLLAEVMAGAKPSFEDPVQYSFAHGGKDGTPYPVNRKVYDKSIQILREALSSAKVERSEKNRAHARLIRYLKES